jgi:hypothetical protein
MRVFWRFLMKKYVWMSLCASMCLAPAAMAQFSISWSTIDSGGGTSSGGAFSVSGTIGQPDAGPVLSGGQFTVVGGFWTGVGGTPRCIADVDDGTFTGTPDGGVTIDDLLYYTVIFEAGAIAADVDDGSFTGTLDGGVTIDDLLYFLSRFNVGC